MRLKHPACILAAALALGIALVGCPSRSNPPPPLVAEPAVKQAGGLWSDSSAAELELGRATVLTRCNHCHGYPTPTEVPLAAWPATITRMLNHCTVTPAESQAVTRYLLAEANLAAGTPAPQATGTPATP